MSDQAPQGDRELVRIGRTPEAEVAIGARLRALRVAAGMSQSTLGEVIGVSFQQIQKYEKGKDRISASTLQVLAAALGVHPGSFFDGEMPSRAVMSPMSGACSRERQACSGSPIPRCGSSLVRSSMCWPTSPSHDDPPYVAHRADLRPLGRPIPCHGRRDRHGLSAVTGGDPVSLGSSRKSPARDEQAG